MTTKSYRILVESGGHPTVTMTEDGGEVFPGYAVTCTGETYNDVCIPDAVGDSVFGVAGLLPTQDIGTVYANNAEIPIHRTGCGDVVMMYHAANGGSIVAGDILVSQTYEHLGYVETLAKALNDFIVDGSAGTILATQIKHIFSLVGRSQETHASSGTVTPIRVLLSI
jgi:hypothetical protein